MVTLKFDVPLFDGRLFGPWDLDCACTYEYMFDHINKLNEFVFVLMNT